MYLFETHKEFIESNKIKPGIKYLAPELYDPERVEDYSDRRNRNTRNSGTKVWEVLSGTPPEGEKFNLFEICKGIPNAYVRNVSGSFYNDTLFDPRGPDQFFDEYFPNTTIDVPINTINRNNHVSTGQFFIFNGTEWKGLRSTYF